MVFPNFTATKCKKKAKIICDLAILSLRLISKGAKSCLFGYYYITLPHLI